MDWIVLIVASVVFIVAIAISDYIEKRKNKNGD